MSLTSEWMDRAMITTRRSERADYNNLARVLNYSMMGGKVGEWEVLDWVVWRNKAVGAGWLNTYDQGLTKCCHLPSVALPSSLIHLSLGG